MNTLKTYITGYALSVAITFASFGILMLHIHTHHTFPTHQFLAVGFVGFALMQLVVQLYFFLHFGQGKNKHWNTAAFVFALFVVAILVGGTLWIMQNLQTLTMQPLQTQTPPFINNQITAQNEND